MVMEATPSATPKRFLPNKNRRGMMTRDTESIGVLNRSMSVPEGDMYCTNRSPNFLGRLKLTLQRKGGIKMVQDPENQRTTFAVGNVLRFEEPIEDMSDETIVSERISDVVINKNSIRNSIWNMMKSRKGNTQILKLIEESPDDAYILLHEASTYERQVALLWACFYKRFEMLPELTRNTDIDFNTLDHGLTALHLASFSGSLECVQYLINRGAMISKPQKHTPLHCAALARSTKCIKFLIASKAPVNDIPSVSPVSPDDINSKKFLFETPSLCQDDTPLHYAIRVQAVDCIVILLKAGADVNRIGEGGMSPLHLAVKLGYSECVKKILECGKSVKINAKTENEKGYTALHIAAEEQWSDIIHILLEFKVDPLSRSARGRTALHIAAKVQSVDCINILLKCIDVNCEDNDEKTPLHLAVGTSSGVADAAQILCNVRGINVDKADKNGQTPLHVAALHELPTASSILIRRGADLTAKTTRGATALGLVSKKIPAAMYAVEEMLDSCIAMIRETARDTDLELKLDFKPLMKRSKDSEVSVLCAFIAENQPYLLEHPLCQAYLHLKWQFAKKFYMARLLFRFLFVLFLSWYSLEFLNIRRYIDQSRNNPSMPYMGKCFFNLENDKTVMSRTVCYGLPSLTLIETLIKLLGILMALCNPKVISLSKVDNLLEWFTLISVPFIMLREIWPLTASFALFQVYLAALSVLASWGTLMLMVGHFPVLGAYVSMYISVLQTILKVFCTYICLLIGFAVSFCLIFKQDVFSNSWTSLVKIICMMIGELDFKDLFFEKGTPPNDNTIEITNTTSTIEWIIYFEYVAYIPYVICVLFVTVAMMNLLVAIAVSDIQGLRKTAGLEKLIREAELVGYIETAFGGPCYCCNPFSTNNNSKNNDYKKPSRRLSNLMHIKPHNFNDTRLPRDIVKALFERARCTGVIYKEKKVPYVSQVSTLSNTDMCPMSHLGATIRLPKSFRMMSQRQKSSTFIGHAGADNDFSREVTDYLTQMEQDIDLLRDEMAQCRNSLSRNEALLKQVLTRLPNMSRSE